MRKIVLFLLIAIWTQVVFASLVIRIHRVDGSTFGKDIGTITADNTIYGLLLTPHLHDLPPGVHGFHLHEFPFCREHADGAGGHYDPLNTGEHMGPYRAGHLGDLPILIVNHNGKATLPVLAPRLKIDQIKNRSLMIDASGDTYSDVPIENGGGGRHIACGEIPYFN